ncbi:MAG: hypothetical protein AAGD10_08160 [Myxococcota bacterium]
METGDGGLGAATAEAARRREKLQASAEALRDRVQEDVKKVQDARAAVRERAVRHRWPLITVAFGVGLAFGRRRRPRYEKVPLALDAPEERAVLIVRSETTAPAKTTLLGSIGGLLIRRAASFAVDWATERLEDELRKPPPP